MTTPRRARYTICLPPALRRRGGLLARVLGLSFSALLAELIERELERLGQRASDTVAPEEAPTRLLNDGMNIDAKVP